MAKETTKENPVTEALRKLKDEEAELLIRIKPIQEAIAALEKIVDKSVKKVKPISAKDNQDDASTQDGDNQEAA
ncbi:MAG: hypothetical protein DI539_26085 [Flavobacterium psychrophilum]|jgi:hypothetical protein|nr:MAG: hypothetical protein DI539_26085 [Flavobacterium psychrophilum]